MPVSCVKRGTPRETPKHYKPDDGNPPKKVSLIWGNPYMNRCMCTAFLHEFLKGGMGSRLNSHPQLRESLDDAAMHALEA